MRPLICNAEGSSRRFSFYGRFTNSYFRDATSNPSAAPPETSVNASAKEQKVVFIGVQLDAAVIKRVLDGCLVSEEESALPAKHWHKWATLWDTLL